MLALLKRLWMVIKSWFGFAIQEMEDPTLILQQKLRESKEALGKYNVQVTGAEAQRLKLKEDIRTAQESIKSFQNHAEQALLQEKEELALMALEKKKAQENLLLDLTEQLATQETVTAELKKQARTIEKRIEIEEMEIRKLASKHKSAKALSNAMGALESLDSESVASATREAKDKIEQESALAQAKVNMQKESLKYQFEELKENQMQSDAKKELEALRAQIRDKKE